MFTLQQLMLSPSPYKCLSTTNLIETPQSDVARRTANVTLWRDREMVKRGRFGLATEGEELPKSMAIEI